MSKAIVFLIFLVVILVGGYFIFIKDVGSPDGIEKDPIMATTTEDIVVEGDGNDPESVIGTSVEGVDIKAYHFGQGQDELLFVGGIHGGYSWNTALVAYELVDYLKSNPEIVPENVKVTVVPVLNPDGLKKVAGVTDGNFTADDVSNSEAVKLSGRFNANDVDLNRNFDCLWQKSGVWQNKNVSGGTAPFSEPETKAIKDYINKNTPEAVITWYSAAGGVYASSCEDGVLEKTTEIMNIYSQASGYPAHKDFDYYEITGDMMNWLAKENIPAISVLLTNHQDVEWTKNKNGIEAVLKYYGK